MTKLHYPDRFLHGFFYNGHEADLVILRLPLRIIDSDKYWVEGAKPTFILKGILQEFLINRYYSIVLITALRPIYVHTLHFANSKIKKQA